LLSRRFAERGFSATRMRLTMARTDIANYLRLAPETVSRVLRRLQDEGVLKVDRRDLEILQPAVLGELAHHVLRDCAARPPPRAGPRPKARSLPSRLRGGPGW